MHGPTSKSRAKRRKMKSRKMLLSGNSTMIHCSLNSVSCLHCSLNSGGMCPLFSEQGRHTPLFTEQCKNCTVHVNFFIFFQRVNFLIFFKKNTSIKWIKFTRTIISILYLIIFYLRSKNYENCSSYRMNFVRNGIINSLME